MSRISTPLPNDTDVLQRASPSYLPVGTVVLYQGRLASIVRHLPNTTRIVYSDGSGQFLTTDSEVQILVYSHEAYCYTLLHLEKDIENVENAQNHRRFAPTAGRGSRG